MSGQQLTALERAEQRDYFGASKNVSELVWLADWRAMRLPYCTIYIIAPLDGWPCKIGISTNPMRRIATLQTACWKQLEVKWCAWLKTGQQAKDLERQAHASLTEQSKWLHGEWFDLRPDKASELVTFEAVLSGLDLETELPAGVPKDFVQKLFDTRYGQGRPGMRGRVERESEKAVRKLDAGY